MKLLQSIDLALSKKLRNKEYREAFFEEWANDEVADQIRRLRTIRKLRQIDVATETGMRQSAVSRLEQSQYSRWNFTTLLRIAQALDARVRVTFEPAEDVIQRYEAAEKDTNFGETVAVAREAATTGAAQNRGTQEIGVQTIRAPLPRQPFYQRQADPQFPSMRETGALGQ